jgi:hypothetical protein
MHHEPIRHLKVEFESGAELTLPAEAWSDQGLVRAMLAAALGRELTSPPMPEAMWTEWVFMVSETAEAEA